MKNKTKKNKASRIRAIQAYYNDFGKKYDTQRSSKYYQFIEKLEKQVLSREITGNNILELGCGTGRFFGFLKKYKKVTAIDNSTGMLRVAKQTKADLKANNIRIVYAPIEKLHFKDNSFDTSISLKVLPHIPYINKAMDEIERVTRKKVVLEFYNKWSLKNLAFIIIIKILKKFLRKKATFTRFYSVDEFKTLFKNKGFKVTRYYGIRIFTPAEFFLNIPVLSQVLGFIEKIGSKTFLKYFGGNLIMCAVKKD